MVFVDILTAQLFSLGFIGLLTAYTMYKMLMGKKNAGIGKAAAIPLLVLGFYVLASSLFGQFTWPLPGSYNILYYDTLGMLGLLTIALGWSFRTGTQIEYTGLLGLFIGAMVIFYGFEAYMLNMSSEPLAVLGLFGLFGLAGVLGYPASMVIDGKMKNAGIFKLMCYGFLIALVFGSLLALFIVSNAVPAHLKSAP